MSSLIEQASRRLEQLRQAGVAVPEIVANTAAAAAAPEVPERIRRGLAEAAAILDRASG